MVDVMSAEERSLLMSRIRGKNTSPEMTVRKLLWGAGFRYRLHAKGLPGRPDIVFAKRRAALFVHGCFWHRHEGCPLFRLPKTRTPFWDDKLQRNRERDARAIATLIAADWRVAVIWECAVRLDATDVGKQLERWLVHATVSIELEARTGSVRRNLLVARN